MRVLKRALCEPVAMSTALMGMLNVAAVFGILHLTNEQLAALNLALASALGYLARLLVTPVHRHRDRGREPLAPRHPAGSG